MFTKLKLMKKITIYIRPLLLNTAWILLKSRVLPTLDPHFNHFSQEEPWMPNYYICYIISDQSRAWCSNIDSGPSNSQAPRFSAQPVRWGLRHLGKAEPGPSPISLLEDSLNKAAFEHGRHTDYLGNLRCPWELGNTTDGSELEQAAGWRALGAIINKTSAQWLISQCLTNTHMERPRLTHSRESSHQRHLPPTVSSHSFTRNSLWASVSPSVQWGEMLHDPHLALQGWQRNWFANTSNISGPLLPNKRAWGIMAQRKSFARGHDSSPRSSIYPRDWQLIKIYWKVSKPWFPINSSLTVLLAPHQQRERAMG